MLAEPHTGGMRPRPMRPEEFDRYREVSVEEYVRDRAANDGVPIETARAGSATALSEILPEGLDTQGHRFFVAEDDVGDRVGVLWLAFRPHDGIDVVWVYDIRVDEERRGRGYGRRIMETAEDLAREMGGERLELNVFGDNPRARGLYESLGYVEISRQMRKDLAEPDER